VLLYDVPMRGDGIYLEETEEVVRLVRLVKKDIGKEDSVLSPLLADKELKTRVDQLNKLYVAFTRASQEMYVIGVNYDKVDEPSAFLPVGTLGTRIPKVDTSKAEKGQEGGRVPLFYGTPARVDRTDVPEGIHPDETRRGEIIHGILARMEYIEGRPEHELKRCMEEEIRVSGVSINGDALSRVLQTFLDSSHMAEFFRKAPDRRVLNEREFVRGDGQLFRLDRVVVDPSTVSVLDYKTGSEREEYAEQVRNYMNIVKDVFPNREVRGFLAYVDTAVVKPVAGRKT